MLAQLGGLPAGVDVDYQLGGATSVPSHVGIVVRDRREEVAQDVYNICYVNAFQTQPDERQVWRRHPALILRDAGHPVVDENWGERLLDIRTATKRKALGRLVGRWISRCAADGYAAVEFDNLDSFTRSHGLLKPRQANRYAARLVRVAHRVGLEAAQKNRAQWDGRRVGFDFAIAEECGRWHECDDYVRHYADQVLAIEYRHRDFERTCAAYGSQLAVVLRDRELSPRGVHEWC